MENVTESLVLKNAVQSSRKTSCDRFWGGGTLKHHIPAAEKLGDIDAELKTSLKITLCLFVLQSGV
jgi:hypothetical protein